MFEDLLNESLPSIIAIGVAAIGVLINLFTFMGIKSRTAKREEARAIFNSLGQELASKDVKINISAAIKIRRFFDKSVLKYDRQIFGDSIKLISSLLRVLPTGVFQKTLADGLAYAKNLSFADLQKTNLQDIYLGLKRDSRKSMLQKTISNLSHHKIYINKVDFYLADLSHSLFEFVDGNAVFYCAILANAKFKNCNLDGASFVNANLTNAYFDPDCSLRDVSFAGANLTGAQFNNVILTGANFSGATNIPEGIELNEDGIYTSTKKCKTPNVARKKLVFFSMPSVMLPEDKQLTRTIESFFKSEGFDVDYYQRDKYTQFGQLNRVSERVQAASAMVVFGFKQSLVQQGIYRPNSSDTVEWKDKWLPTPWNAIEVGMGMMKKMPILIIKDEDIDTGVFDSVLTEHTMQTILSSEVPLSLCESKILHDFCKRI